MGALRCGRLGRGGDLPEHVTYSRSSSGESENLKGSCGGLGRDEASLGRPPT
jgi:hypothetical protein